MEIFLTELMQVFGDQRVRTSEHLEQYSPQNSTVASFFLTVTSRDELMSAIAIARKSSVPFAILDQMTDPLYSLQKFEGLVIKDSARKFDILARKGKIQSGQMITDYVLLEAESGTPFNQLVRFTLDEGFSGIESGLGLPGSVGRVVKGETAYMQHLFDAGIVQSATILTAGGEKKEVLVSDLIGSTSSDLIVLSIVFKLQGEDKKILWLKAQYAAKERGIEDLTTI